ncbi:MAG: hypothetical protein L0Z62_28920 [Gemmataceae bacterium]|nr:hypothetical protein [Gemmataceae bacterium]
MARDATARQYDVDADAVVLNTKEGTVTFQAKKGRLVDLDKLHESIWATRLSGGTGMALNWIDVTAAGDVVSDQQRMRLQVTGSDQYFVLMEDPNTKPQNGAKPPLERLREALERGEKVVSVTGRLDGWKGHFPPFLGKLPEKPRRILVKEFQTAKN